jgi:hypothetical protein
MSEGLFCWCVTLLVWPRCPCLITVYTLFIHSFIP